VLRAFEIPVLGDAHVHRIHVFQADGLVAFQAVAHAELAAHRHWQSVAPGEFCSLGAVARPSRVLFVTALRKTRSGELLRRALQAVAEHRDPGDMSTIEDPNALQQIKALVMPGCALFRRRNMRARAPVGKIMSLKS
jgi:hypothetical protein